MTTAQAEAVTALVVPDEEPKPLAEALNPMAMLAKAVESGADVGVLERLVGLSERFQAACAKRAFTAALTAARSELPTIVKNQQVSYGSTKYKYEDLAEIAELVSPVLAKHGLSFRWRTDSGQPGEVAVTYVLEHVDGHSEDTTLSGPYDQSGGKNAIQAIGSCVTYLQRYTLKAALGIAAARDDDGQQGRADKAPPTRANGNGSRAAAKPEPAPTPVKDSWPNIYTSCARLVKLMNDPEMTVEKMKALAGNQFEGGESAATIQARLTTAIKKIEERQATS